MNYYWEKSIAKEYFYTLIILIDNAKLKIFMLTAMKKHFFYIFAC